MSQTYTHACVAIQQIGEAKSGVLEKKGRRLNGYKTYFFKINNLYLDYYASEADAGEKSPLGVFFLSALVGVVRNDRCINLQFGTAKFKRQRTDNTVH